MTDLAGKVAVITGASRGLGQRVAIRLADQGATVVLVARSEAVLEATARGIVQKGGRAEVVSADLSDPRSLDAVVAGAHRVGVPSILVNAAGVFGPLQLIKDSDPREWTETLMINMISHYLTCRAFVGGMIDQGWGRIINVTSANALHPPGPLHSAYGTSKAALNHFTRHLAAEVNGSGVTANVIHPGDVKTEMWADIRAKAQRVGPRGGAVPAMGRLGREDRGRRSRKSGGSDRQPDGRRGRLGQRPVLMDQRRVAGADPELERPIGVAPWQK